MDLPHRKRVGGLWDEVDRLQFDFLVRQGLRPQHRLLGVGCGCGCFRGASNSRRYLEPGRYYGLDADASLIEADFIEELG